MLRKIFRRRVPRPKLRSQKSFNLPRGTEWVKKKRRNYYVPGFVYIFHDLEAIRGKGISLCKIGLSRTPRRRRYYLSEEYGSNLRIRAIVPTMNMRLTELLMHKIFVGSRDARTPGLDGYTEWFHVDFLRVKKMQITLFALAAFINFAYFTAATFIIMFFYYLIFRLFLW